MQQSATRPTRVGQRSLPDVIGLGGATAGFLAGAVMVLLSPILSLLAGISIWLPPRLIAATFLGSSAIEETGFAIGPVLMGLVIHMITSVVLGIIFGIVTHRVLHLTTDFGLPIYAGLAYGLIVFFVAQFIILPLVNPSLAEFTVTPFMAQNVIYGLCLGLFFILVRPQPYTNTTEDR